MRRASLALLSFIIAIHVAYLLPQRNDSQVLSKNYSLTTCPGSMNKSRAVALLPTSNLSYKYLSALTKGFRSSGSGNLLLTQGAIVEKGDPRNSLSILSSASNWTTATNCPKSTSESWFVGGTADVSSQGVVSFVNSGLSEASVEATAFTENGPVAPQMIKIPAATEKRARIDSFSPGASRVVLHVVVRSGRVSSFVLDEQTKGLKNLGGDLINPISMPSQSILIPALPSKLGKNSKIISTLRVLAPGNADGSVSVEIITPKSTYIPVELGNIAINSQEVRDISLAGIDFGDSNFALRIKASVPIVASVKTIVSTPKISDFTWHTAVNPISQIAFNLYGLEPMITFVADAIDVDVNWRDASGKSHNKTLIGQSILNWQVPPNVRLINFASRQGVSAAMVWTSADGIAYLPLAIASTIESASRPIADAGVLQSRT